MAAGVARWPRVPRDQGARVQVRLSASMLSVLVLVACDRPEIHSYRVPKEQSAGGERMADVNPELPPRAGGAVVWTAPADWRSVQSDQPMRLATFDAGGAEVTVTAFPGAVGGNLANVNRWRGQIGLDPVDDAAVAQLLTTSREGATEVSLLTMAGKDGKVLLGAIIVPGDGQTWFAKSVTDEARAKAVADAFAAFAKSFRLQGGGSSEPNASARSAPSTPESASPASGVTDIEARLAHYAPPAHWKSEGAAGGIVAAAYNATNDGRAAHASPPPASPTTAAATWPTSTDGAGSSDWRRWRISPRSSAAISSPDSSPSTFATPRERTG